MDFTFLNSLKVDVNIAKCHKCKEYGHKDNKCETEVIFEDMNGQKKLYT